MYVPWHCSPDEQNTNTCLLYFFCGFVMRLRRASHFRYQSLSARLRRFGCGFMGSLLKSYRKAFSFMWCRVKTPVTVCGCRPMQMCCCCCCSCCCCHTVFFLTGKLQFGPGAGRDGCPLHKPTEATRL